jgi:hypothetical protein
MGISIREFQVAMETIGAKRLADRMGSRYRILVPCFQIKKIKFFHSGSYYVVHPRNSVDDDVMNRAMAEVGEKHPGGDNFWWGEVHSIKGMLILATMLRGDYSRALVDELTNKAYKKLLKCSSIKNNVKFPFEFSTHSPKMQELHQLLEEYSSVINPFGNNKFKIKEPIEYLDKVKVQLSAGYDEGGDAYSRLTLLCQSFETLFSMNSEGWTYRSSGLIQKDNKNGFIRLSHYYGKCEGEIVYLDYKVEREEEDNFKTLPEDIDLNINVKTGLAWETYKRAEAVLATEEQLDVMISCLKMCIRSVKEYIIHNIVVTKA